MTWRRVPVRSLQLLRAQLVFFGHGVSLGSWPKAEGRGPRIHNAGSMRIGERVVIIGHQFRASLTTGPDGTLEVGSRVLINQGASIHAARSVRIGDGVRIADLVGIYDTDFHEVDQGKGPKIAPVVIGDNVWIGRGSTVLPGVTIGSNSVIAAGSVVTGDIPEDCLAAGVPARVLRALHVEPGYRRH